MNHRIISAATGTVMVISLISPSFASAVESSVKAHGSVGLFESIRTNIKAEVNAEVKDFRNAIKNDRKENKEDKERVASKSQEFKARAEAKLIDARKKHIKNWWTRVSKRLSNIIEQEKKFTVRVEKRLDALAASGVDVAKQRTALAAARVKMDVAAQSLVSANAQVDTIISTNTPSEALPKLRDLHKGVMAKIRDAHRALVDVVVQVKILH